MSPHFTEKETERFLCGNLGAQNSVEIQSTVAPHFFSYPSCRQHRSKGSRKINKNAFFFLQGGTKPLLTLCQALCRDGHREG